MKIYLQCDIEGDITNVCVILSSWSSKQVETIRRRNSKIGYDIFQGKGFENRSHTLSTSHQRVEQMLGGSDRPQEAGQVRSHLVGHQRRRAAALPPRQSNGENNLVGNLG